MIDKVAIAEKNIAERLSVTGRKCGACSMCCRLLDVPEINKPKHNWCQHCRPGNGGCTIYDQRPGICRSYACQWLMYPLVFGDEWFPPKAKIVADFHFEDNGAIIARFHVDPRFPNRWREEPYYSKIRRFALAGLRGELDGRQFQTIVSIKGKWTLILPHKEVPYSPGITMPFGPDHFEFLPCKTNDDVRKLDGFLRLMRDAGTRARRAHPALDPLALMEVVARDPQLLSELEKSRRRDEGHAES